MPVEVESSNLSGRVTALGAAGPFTLTIDRPVEVGGGGQGFSGGQLMYLAVAACVSNDLFREAATRGINLERVSIRVAGDFVGDPATSTEVTYDVDLRGDAAENELRSLVEHVDRIAEIPNSLRQGTRVRLRDTSIGATS